MESYKIVIKRSATKEIERIPKSHRKRIVSKIQELSKEPRPLGVKKLSGEEKYRIRQGDYRILYKVEDSIITVTVVKVGNRKDVYR
ncbi:type II toxin-antitoxin system RelE/ParE family toxin [Puniceicoccales bacterium CK1056]|uniref:Type II toxin-antitoxin system RelE/ParE family toxin n=1 Tax=Oceanipulchritudo coccoides TaxID=2706888 RepID=A0A6B2LYZ7_9BACT|nr:type II toxin-antitoxin system RelE/ParE family toxin [Oceanipulchritudo coccoides]